MENELKIPKIIHYCWFGGNPLSEAAMGCIESWKKFCPDYEIMEWNETNFRADFNSYVKEAYEAKKWAFVSDVARLVALVNYGGVYMDTDVELVKGLDEVLSGKDTVLGFEAPDAVLTGFMACTKENGFFAELLSRYDGAHFINENGEQDVTTNVIRVTNACIEKGLILNGEKQSFYGITVYPSDYFCAKDLVTGELNVTENTHSIHHYDGSWLSEEKKYAKDFRKRHKHIPRFMALHVSGFVAACKYRGLFAAIKEIGIYFSDRKKQKRLKKELRSKNEKG